VANPARFAIDHPHAVVLAALLLLVYGVLSYEGLPRQENPTLTERFASVITYLPGAEPEKVELLVTKVIEDGIAEVDDIHEIFSRSGHGVSFVLIQVEKTAPARQRLQEIRDKVQEARAEFPSGTSEPDVDTRVFRTNTLLLALTGEGVSPLVLREQAQELERDLERLPGVRRVELVGLPEEEIEVAVDIVRLSQRGVPLARVVDALAARNVELPSGELEVGFVRSSIQTTGAFRGAEEVGATYLGAGQGGLPIRLADVASVRRRLAEPEVRVRAQGVPAVGIAIEMLPDRNAIELGRHVRRLLDARELPNGMHSVVVADEPTYVEERLSLLAQSLFLGLLLVVTFSLLGMGWRSGVVVSLSIPLALTVALGLQGAVNVPLHQISIAALVIAIGIVVDESIVVTDSIQRHLDRGSPPREAAIEGLGEVHLAVLAGAATTVAAFIPLMAMKGDIGEFIRSIPIVVSLMLLGSVLVAHFVTPLLALALHRRSGGGGHLMQWVEPLYRPLLRSAVQRPHRVLACFVGVIALTLVMMASWLWPPVFFPDADRHQFLVKVHLPTGAPLEETDAVVARIETRLARDPELADWTAFVGRDAPKFYYNEFDDGRAENLAQIIVNTKWSVPFSRTREVASRVDADLDSHVPGAWIRTHPLRQGYGDADDVEIFLLGDNLDVLRVLTAEVRALVEEVPGVVDARDSFGYDPVTLLAQVDAARANLLGVTHQDVATTLRIAVDGVTATTYREDDEEIDIRVRLDEAQRRHVTDLASLSLHSPVTRTAVPLSHVVALEPGWTTRSVQRWNRKRESYVGADVRTGYSLLEVAAEVERLVRDRIAFPPGYEAQFFGQRVEVTESFDLTHRDRGERLDRARRHRQSPAWAGCLAARRGDGRDSHAAARRAADHDHHDRRPAPAVALRRRVLGTLRVLHDLRSRRVDRAHPGRAAGRLSHPGTSPRSRPRGVTRPRAPKQAYPRRSAGGRIAPDPAV
jgi:multidrug efflux pump subunit AcrB